MEIRKRGAEYSRFIGKGTLAKICHEKGVKLKDVREAGKKGIKICDGTDKSKKITAIWDESKRRYLITGRSATSIIELLRRNDS